MGVVGDGWVYGGEDGVSEGGAGSANLKGGHGECEGEGGDLADIYLNGMLRGIRREGEDNP